MNKYTLLKKGSLYMNKDETFLLYPVVKFFMCEEINYEGVPLENVFNNDDYYMLLYFVFYFKDYNKIHEDQVLGIIFIIYTFFVDDWGSNTDIFEPALTKYSKTEFANTCIQLSIVLIKEIMKFIHDSEFLNKWKIECDCILNNNTNLPLFYNSNILERSILFPYISLSKKCTLLKKINIKLNKGLLKNGR